MVGPFYCLVISGIPSLPAAILCNMVSRGLADSLLQHSLMFSGSNTRSLPEDISTLQISKPCHHSGQQVSDLLVLGWCLSVMSLCYFLCCSMGGMVHTAEAFATGMRNLRTRVPDQWMAKGNEWVNLPTLYIR